MMANQRTGCGPATALIWPLTRSKPDENQEGKKKKKKKEKKHGGTRKTEPHTWPKDARGLENIARKREFRNSYETAVEDSVIIRDRTKYIGRFPREMLKGERISLEGLDFFLHNSSSC